MSKLLAIDPAVRGALGWATFWNAELRDCGTIRISATTNKWSHLWEFLDEHSSDKIAYELVMRHTGVIAAQLYGGCVAVIQLWAQQHNIAALGIGVQTGKKALTGTGGASKDDSVRAALRRFDLHVTHDVADAIGIGLAAL